MTLYAFISAYYIQTEAGMDFEEDMLPMDVDFCYWLNLPEPVVLYTFSHLSPQDLLKASQVCTLWHRLAKDEFLWRHLVCISWKLDEASVMEHPITSWQGVYKNYYYHAPVVESEVITDYKDEVWNVSFSHSGHLFATCSRDGSVKVNVLSYI